MNMSISIIYTKAYRPRTLVVHSAWKLPSWVLGTLWVGVLRTLKGPPPLLPFTPPSFGWLFLHSFFDFVLVPSFFGFWCQLGANLPPKMVPKSTKNRSKSRPTSIPTSILSSIQFFIDFGFVFCWFFNVRQALKPWFFENTPAIIVFFDFAASIHALSS